MLMIIKLILKNKNGESKKVFEIKEKGSYAFYVDGDYQNPTFMVTIEEPVAKIEKPTIKDYAYVYNGNMFKFYPENFDANTMDIAYYMQKDVGKYTAQVSLKNSWQFTWSDGTTDSIEYPFEIIHPGVVLKDNSNFDYIYKDSNNLRQRYKDNKIIHKVSENENNKQLCSRKYCSKNNNKAVCRGNKKRVWIYKDIQ